jgi:hypothetical protein
VFFANRALSSHVLRSDFKLSQHCSTSSFSPSQLSLTTSISSTATIPTLSSTATLSCSSSCSKNQSFDKTNSESTTKTFADTSQSSKSAASIRFVTEVLDEFDIKYTHSVLINHVSGVQSITPDELQYNVDENKLKQYLSKVATGKCDMAYYKEPVLGSTLVSFLCDEESESTSLHPSSSSNSMYDSNDSHSIWFQKLLLDFQQAVEMAVPDAYEWIPMKSLHVTIRGL